MYLFNIRTYAIVILSISHIVILSDIRKNYFTPMTFSKKE